MKVKRVRRFRRTLGFFKNNYGIRTPYQVLIDGTFCTSALKYKINLKEQIPKFLEAEVKFLTTACCIMEVESLGPATYGAMLVAKQFSVRKCGHEKNPLPASECLYSMLSKNNPDHYFIATQDEDLIEKVRNMPGVPLLFIRYNTIIIGKPSTLSFDAVEEKREQLDKSDYHLSVVQQLKKQVFGEQTPVQKKKKRKFKGDPNSISKKKKKLMQEQVIVERSPEKKKRRRHRVRIAKHVKELLKSTDLNEK